MKKNLFATTAIVAAFGFGASAANAQDASLSLSAFSQFYANYVDQDVSGTGHNADGDYDFQTNTEVEVNGEVTLDNGITAGMSVEFEADNADGTGGGGDDIDENLIYLSGSFGRVEFGHEDGAVDTMRYGATSIKAVYPGGYNNTTGTFINYIGNAPGATNLGDSGDGTKVNYYTPRFAGIQAGITLAPDSAVAHFRLAQAYRAGDRGDLAARHLAKAVTLRPDHLGALALLARVQIERERFADAAEAIDRLRTMVPPEDLRLIQLQTSLAVAEGRMGDAAALYARHFASSPSSGVAARLALLQHGAGDTDGALATLADWTADHPADVPVLKARGDLAASVGRWSVAADQYRAVLDVAPDDASARNNLAYSLWKAGRAQEALPEAERAITLDPTNPNVLDTLGLVYVSTGRIEDGIGLIQQAVQDQPANPGYRYHLAWARSRAGEPAAAKEILDVVLAEYPDFPEREEALALLEQLGR